MSWARRLRSMLAHFGIVRATQTRQELRATQPKHDRAVREMDSMLRDYERGDKVLQLRVVRKRQ